MTRPRRLLAVALLGWLNVLLMQPCVMAASQHNEHDVNAVALHVSHPDHEFATLDQNVHRNMGDSCDGVTDTCCVRGDTAKPNNEPKSSEYVEILNHCRSEWFEGILFADAGSPAVPTGTYPVSRPVSLSIEYCVYLI